MLPQEGLQEQEHWHAHDAEIWACCYSRMQVTTWICCRAQYAQPRLTCCWQAGLLFTGADDSLLKAWDTRSPSESPAVLVR